MHPLPECHEVVEPRCLGAVVADFLKAENMSQSDLAERLGVKRQHIHGVIKGDQNLSEQKIRQMAQIFRVPAESILGEIKRHNEWISSPEGIERVLKLRQSQFIERFTMRGVNWLDSSEIRQARDCKLIEIANQELEHFDLAMSVVGDPTCTDICCHLDGKCVESHELNHHLASNCVSPEMITIAPQKSIVVRTAENFRLGAYAELFFNGLHPNLDEEPIIPIVRPYSRFIQSDCFMLRLHNYSTTPISLERGKPIAFVRIFFNPFSQVDQTQ